MRRLNFRLFFAALLFFNLLSAQAAGTGYLGLEAGVALLNAGAGSRFDWGLTGGTRTLPNILVGGYYTYIPFGSVSSPSGISVSGSEKFYGAEGRFDFTPMFTGLSAGLRAGLSSISTQAIVPGRPEDDESSNGFAWGPIVVYERPISTSLTFGSEFYFMTPSEAAANNVFGALATLKFWF